MKKTHNLVSSRVYIDQINNEFGLGISNSVPTQFTIYSSASLFFLLTKGSDKC